MSNMRWIWPETQWLVKDAILFSKRAGSAAFHHEIGTHALGNRALPSNPSLQRTLPGRSPGQRR